LSYGEKRLVTLASVFVMKPSLLLLDEPTNGLDEASWARVCELLRKWPGAMLVASHDKALLSLLSLETWKLEHGRLETVGV
jgi:cobalt/nickel transport system ATP-binding protein